MSPESPQQIDKRKNPTLKYLLNILDFYYAKEAGEYINSKIGSFLSLDNGIFCRACSRTYIPKITCNVKDEKNTLRIVCICGYTVVLDYTSG